MRETIETRDYRKIKKEISKNQKESYKLNVFFRNRVKYIDAYNKYKVKKNIILYQAYFGRGLICNPYALFKQILKDERFQGFTHMWVLDDLSQHEVEIQLYKKYKNVIFIEIESEEYYKYLSSAKYLINNVTFPYYFVRKEEQVILNTWHGIPLKHLGYDMPRGNVETSNMLRNFMMSDYIVSPTEFTTENFRTAYKLQGIYEGKIIETGYPRNDVFFNVEKSQLIEKFKKFGVDIDPNKKVVIYAPTWKGEQYGKPDLDISSYERFLDTVYQYVDRDKYQVLFKPHQVVYKHLRDKGMLASHYIPALIDTNELLSITDILISDYSSIFFDFMVTGKPILFYIPDLETYTETRGLYFKPDSLPGPITKDVNEIGKWLKDIDNYNSFFDNSKYEKVREWSVKYDDGHVCERIIDTILGKQGETIVHSDFSNEKIKLLIHNDTMKTNGITSSVMNLLNHLDYDKYDVTLCVCRSRKNEEEEAEENMCNVNPKARVFFRNTTYSGTLQENISNELVLRYGVENVKKRKDFPKAFYEREFNRCFPNTHFDYVINFAGYSNFMALVLATQSDCKKLIWMHNDMLAERERFENGEERFKVLASIYDLYDRYVSCSKSVMEINYKNLGTDDTKDKFSYARNLVDNKRILEGIAEERWIKIAEEPYYVKNIEEEPQVRCRIEVVNGIEEGTINFVTMGRLSMEKNHLNLIEAFKRLYDENDKVRLHILGEGPLKDEEDRLIKKLKLQNIVHLTGNLSNPFAYIKNCDCYIMPSLHEGQPMAILEARMMGMPIIVSDFSTIKDSLYEKGQLLIQKDVDSIYQGMKAFIEGNVPNDFIFNVDEYNELAIKEFLDNLVF